MDQFIGTRMAGDSVYAVHAPNKKVGDFIQVYYNEGLETCVVIEETYGQHVWAKPVSKL